MQRVKRAFEPDIAAKQKMKGGVNMLFEFQQA